MEYIAWEQLTSALEMMIRSLKNLKSASSADLKVYSLYIILMVVGVRFKIDSLSPKVILPAFITLAFSTLAFSLTLNEKESNYYIIIAMFYVKCLFYYLNVNLKTSMACAIMAVYLLIMSREAAYYEVHKQSFSDLLHDTYWVAIFLLHCIICASFLSRHQYKRTYMGLRSLIRGG